MLSKHLNTLSYKELFKLDPFAKAECSQIVSKIYSFVITHQMHQDGEYIKELIILNEQKEKITKDQLKDWIISHMKFPENFEIICLFADLYGTYLNKGENVFGGRYFLNMLHHYLLKETNKPIKHHWLHILLRKKPENINYDLDEILKVIEKHKPTSLMADAKPSRFEDLILIYRLTKDQSSIIQFLDKHYLNPSFIHTCQKEMKNYDIELVDYEYKKISLVNNFNYGLKYELQLAHIKQNNPIVDANKMSLAFINYLEKDLKKNYEEITVEKDSHYQSFCVNVKRIDCIVEVKQRCDALIEQFILAIPHFSVKINVNQILVPDYDDFFNGFFSNFMLLQKLDSTLSHQESSGKKIKL